VFAKQNSRACRGKRVTLNRKAIAQNFNGFVEGRRPLWLRQPLLLHDYCGVLVNVADPDSATVAEQ